MSISEGLKVRYAIAQKKQRSLMRPKFIADAKSQEIDLVPIKPQRPLVEQGRFDSILALVTF
jgi:hypothetical protein